MGGGVAVGVGVFEAQPATIKRQNIENMCKGLEDCISKFLLNVQ